MLISTLVVVPPLMNICSFLSVIFLYELPDAGGVMKKGKSTLLKFLIAIFASIVSVDLPRS